MRFKALSAPHLFRSIYETGPTVGVEWPCDGLPSVDYDKEKTVNLAMCNTKSHCRGHVASDGRRPPSGQGSKAEESHSQLPAAGNGKQASAQTTSKASGDMGEAPKSDDESGRNKEMATN